MRMAKMIADGKQDFVDQRYVNPWRTAKATHGFAETAAKPRAPPTVRDTPGRFPTAPRGLTLPSPTVPANRFPETPPPEPFPRRPPRVPATTTREPPRASASEQPPGTPQT